MMLKARDPRTGKDDYYFPAMSKAEVWTTCLRLREHQPAWKSAGAAGRIAALKQWKESVERKKDRLVKALCTDTGRRWETILEADLVASSIDRWCGIAKDFLRPAKKKPSSIPFISLKQELEPFPLVGVISPWNFPLLLSLIDTIPALLAGCAVAVKPSEVTPRFIEVMQDTIRDVPLLKDVFAYMQGDGETGESLVSQSDLICFTGSTATGRKVYAAAAQRMIPVFLEMGGKDPAVVLEGADLDAAASAVLWGSTANAGQSCLSIERVYVQDGIHDEFVKRLCEKASKVGLAYPTMDDGVIGPIIFKKQVDIINEHIADAVAKGAYLETGSSSCEKMGGGWYCRPTVLTRATHEMLVMKEETFGPIMPVMRFKNVDEAVALANGTVYGLSGAVFARTDEEAMAVARRIEGGAMSINDAALTAVMHEGEKNSFRLSGIGGTRMGPSAMKRFMRQKVMIIKDKEVKSPWWYRDA